MDLSFKLFLESIANVLRESFYVAPNTASRRSPPSTVLPGAFAAALSVLFFILVLRFYREWGGSTYADGLNASRWKIAYAVAAVAIFVPLLTVADGCGGAATIPAAQKSSIVTPSGTSTLVITPALQEKRCS